MEKTKRVKNEEKMNDDLPSTSTSNSPSQVEPVLNIDIDQEINMDDLPAEMLAEILKCVDTLSLLKNCRLVSRTWCEISNVILHHRPGTQKWFGFHQPHGKEFTTYYHGSLKDFLDCMKNCRKSCPFARFNFKFVVWKKPEEFFQHEDWLQFLADFGTSTENKNPNPNQNENRKNKTQAKSLEFEISFFENNDNNSVSHFAIVIDEIRDFLLNKLQNLEEFSLGFSHQFPDSQIRLFPATTSTESMKKFQLPQLKKIILPTSSFSRFPGITKDLLTGAVNLKKIHLDFQDSALTLDLYNLLCSLGKLELLKRVQIIPNQDFVAFISAFMQKTNPFQGFKLQEIEINTTSLANICRSNSNSSRIFSLNTNFLSNLLESNKVTLKSLMMKPCGLLRISETNQRICFPAFKNLTNLTLIQFYHQDHPCAYWYFFPPGIRSLEIFPAVNNLYLQIKDWTAAFPREDFIPRLPRLRSLEINEKYVTKFACSKLALLCPNLRNLCIHKNNYYESPKLNLLEVGRSIWTEMKTLELECLELDVDLNLPLNDSTALDSCFTGISVENCRRLNEAKESELELPTDREYASILNMKDLKKLKINPYFGGELLDKQEFSNKLTWISQEYAFKLIPQLKLNDEN